eukprot:CAMPEP_0169243600 /NCGR_PEP_ID=MMETSP1016-20121227/33179_1 /TAXON_ID=342587 /ORGANISM="Karlodinium micrum, Strain CCMP2283" /LENGTH=36 /DNA_ID= /DNA_START= /DNA_END= /DNA_ORIENTATION=
MTLLMRSHRMHEQATTTEQAWYSAPTHDDRQQRLKK